MSFPNITTLGALKRAIDDAVEAGWSEDADVRLATFEQIALPVGKAARRDLMNGLPGFRGLFLPRDVDDPGALEQEPIIFVIDPMPGT
jgi:hypothetical protein